MYTSGGQAAFPPKPRRQRTAQHGPASSSPALPRTLRARSRKVRRVTIADDEEAEEEEEEEKEEQHEQVREQEPEQEHKQADADEKADVRETERKRSRVDASSSTAVAACTPGSTDRMGPALLASEEAGRKKRRQ